MARLTVPIRKVAAIYLTTTSNGITKYVREQYNVVTLDYGDGSDVQSYMEPICGRPLSPSETRESYDEVRYYTSPPFPRSRIGMDADALVNPGT